MTTAEPEIDDPLADAEIPDLDEDDDESDIGEPPPGQGEDPDWDGPRG